VPTYRALQRVYVLHLPQNVQHLLQRLLSQLLLARVKTGLRHDATKGVGNSIRKRRDVVPALKDPHAPAVAQLPRQLCCLLAQHVIRAGLKLEAS